MDRAADTGGLWDRLRGRHRILVTNLLAVVSAAAALAGLGVVAVAVRQSRDESLYPTFPGQEEIPALVVLDEALHYSVFSFEFSLVWIGILAALGVFALAGHPSSVALPLTWRRGVAAVGIGGVAVPLALGAFRLFVAVYAMSAMPEAENINLASRDWLLTLANLIGPGIAVLLGVALIVIALAWWPVRPGEPGLLADDDEDEVVETDLATTPDGYAPRTTYERPAAAEEQEPAPPPRLRADGSSDSGYDEFRFRR